MLYQRLNAIDSLKKTIQYAIDHDDKSILDAAHETYLSLVNSVAEEMELSTGQDAKYLKIVLLYAPEKAVKMAYDIAFKEFEEKEGGEW